MATAGTNPSKLLGEKSIHREGMAVSCARVKGYVPPAMTKPLDQDRVACDVFTLPNPSPSVDQMQRILQQTFSQLEEEIKRQSESQTAGTTLTVSVVFKDITGKVYIVTANVGDSPAFVTQKNPDGSFTDPQQLTEEHNLRHIVEQDIANRNTNGIDKFVDQISDLELSERTKKSLVEVYNSETTRSAILRVGGARGIAVTKALGDETFVYFGLSHIPDISVVEISGDTTQIRIALASDGIETDTLKRSLRYGSTSEEIVQGATHYDRDLCKAREIYQDDTSCVAAVIDPQKMPCGSCIVLVDADGHGKKGEKLAQHATRSIVGGGFLNFLKNHWKVMLLGVLAGAALALLTIATFGTVAAIAVAAGAAIKVSGAVVAGTVGAIVSVPVTGTIVRATDRANETPLATLVRSKMPTIAPEQSPKPKDPMAEILTAPASGDMAKASPPPPPEPVASKAGRGIAFLDDHIKRQETKYASSTDTSTPQSGEGGPPV